MTLAISCILGAGAFAIHWWLADYRVAYYIASAIALVSSLRSKLSIGDIAEATHMKREMETGAPDTKTYDEFRDRQIEAPADAYRKVHYETLDVDAYEHIDEIK